MRTASTESLYREFRDRLKIFINSKVHNDELAEDLLHDTFVKVHSKLNSLKDNEKIVSWIYSIARNVIIDHIRKQKPSAELNDAIDLSAPAISGNIMEKLQSSVKNMIECLPQDYRNALMMTEYEGLSQKEAAERLGLSLPGAKSRVQRARKLLKQMLFDCCHFEFDKYGAVIDYYQKQKSCQCCKV